MNRVLETLKHKERSVNWLAVKLVMSRQTLSYKIAHNTFTLRERKLVAEVLIEPLSTLFPEPDPAPEAA